VEVFTRTISVPWDQAQERSDQVNIFADLTMQVTRLNSPTGESLESATKFRKTVAEQHIATPTSKKRRLPSKTPTTDSPSKPAFPNNASPPTYVDTICEIVGKWPGLEKRIILREGEKMREIRHPGKSEEMVKSGFQNVFSTQSKKQKPRIQGRSFGQIDAEGRVVSDSTTCRWLLAGVDPKGVQLWEAPSVPLLHGNPDGASAHDARHDNIDTIEVRDSTSHIRRAVGTDEGEHTSGELEENRTEKICGLPEGGAYHSNLQGTTSCTDTSNQDSISPQVETAEVTRNRQTSPRESVVRDESTEMNAFDEWSERAQGDYWGFQVRRKKNLLSKLRDTEGSLTKLSCQSAQMKEFEDTDASQLRDLEDKMRDLRERIHERAMETNGVHQKESIASEAATDLRKQICDVDETLDRYWADDE
jgi:hypothetical protein